MALHFVNKTTRCPLNLNLKNDQALQENVVKAHSLSEDKEKDKEKNSSFSYHFRFIWSECELVKQVITFFVC